MKAGTISSRKAGASSTVNVTAANLTANLNNTSANFFDHKTYIKVLHNENQVILLNCLCSCLHMVNHLKEQLHLSKDEAIDLIDFDGNLKEIPNQSSKDYVVQFIAPTTSFAVVKIELDQQTNEKRYICLLNESKLSGNMLKALTTLNTGKNMSLKDKAKLTRETRIKQQQQTASSTAITSNAASNASINDKTTNLNSSLNSRKTPKLK